MDEDKDMRKFGIGLKMLINMGYKGGGLGKSEQGNFAPIEVKMRPKYMGLGFNDYHESMNLPNLMNWAPPLESNLENLCAEEEKEEEVMEVDSMEELKYNMGLMVDMAEFDIEKVERDLRNEREAVFALQEEKEILEKEDEGQKKQMESIEEVLQVLECIEEENLGGRLTLEFLVQTFEDLHRRFPEEYKLCKLSSTACDFGLPLLNRVFEEWDPLQNPSHGMDVIAWWKGFLQGVEDHDIFEDDASSPYSQLVDQVVFPAVRRVGLEIWQVEDFEPMLQFLELWEKLIPPCVLQSILDKIVMPKLSEAVNSWEPCREPIDKWVHPWLPLLGNNNLETLYQAICAKLETVLVDWHPSDESAYNFLSPWLTVFDSPCWQQIIVRSILPKLVDVMLKFQVNPANEKLEEFNWVMIWASVVPIHHMVCLLENHFFSKWKLALIHWLCTNPDFEEVTRWYFGWKERIPPDVLAYECVKKQIYLGLKILERAADDVCMVQPEQQRQYEAQQNVPANTDSLHLKEVIELYALQQGLHFKPKPGRLHNHLQVYSFGSLSIIVDSFNAKIFAHVQEDWYPVCLEQLVQMQNISGSRRH